MGNKYLIKFLDVIDFFFGLICRAVFSVIFIFIVIIPDLIIHKTFKGIVSNDLKELKDFILEGK